MLKEILDKLAILWKLSEPKYLLFLERQTRDVIKKVEDIHITQEELRKRIIPRPATVVQDDPLDIFPSDEGEQDTNLTGKLC